MDMKYLSKLAIGAAIAAGKVIQQYDGQQLSVEQKAGGESYASQVLTIVDTAAEAVILAHLRPSCREYGIALLSEETADDGGRHEADFFWCIDPMDGTLAFIKAYPGYAVSIALVAQDGTPHIGVVYDPSTATLYHAIRGGGVFKNGDPWSITNTNTHLTYVTDKQLQDTHRASDIGRLIHTKVEQLSLAEAQEMAGAGAVLNAIRVLENGPAFMVKLPKESAGGGSIWDYAATACIYHELGLKATDYSGAPLQLNSSTGTFMNHSGILYTNLLSE